MEDKLQPESLSFKTFVLSAFCVTLALVILVFGTFQYNEYRKNQVIAKYTDETHQFINQNKDELKKLFSETFDNCEDYINAISITKNYYSNVDCSYANDVITALIGKDNLIDYSAIAFVKKYDNRDIALIESSGKYRRRSGIESHNILAYSYRANTESDLGRYLFEGKDINKWQDFISYLPEKQVVVPVEINGQTLGYIFRSMIEK